MLVSDLGKWLEARDLVCRIVTIAPGKCNVDLYPKGKPLVQQWFGSAPTVEAAVETAKADYDLRDCTGLPVVREVDGTCR